jgi:hypothetical protein
MIPVLVFFLIPIFLSFERTSWRWRPAQLLFVLLAAASTVIHAEGSISTKANAWNSIPVNVDLHPQRLWDWSDPQFLRGFRR